MNNSLPPPPIQPFERLRVMDGLLVNAHRWRLAHDYHRQRQNFHYQSLHQPGIVCGLGICVITAPAEVPPKFRDGRWLQIQPGLALDLVGNPIVIAQPIEFHISSAVLPDEPLLVYVTVSYVDPDNLRRRGKGETVQETFRIDEKTTPPDEMEVELCRVLLQSGTIQLQSPNDVFFPEANTLDLRYRVQAKTRPQAVVHLAQLVSGSAEKDLSSPFSLHAALAYLSRSVASLYPAMQGAEAIGQIDLQDREAIATVLDYDLVCLKNPASLGMQTQMVEVLREYLQVGGTVLVEVTVEGTQLAPLMAVKQQLEEGLTKLRERIARLELATSDAVSDTVLDLPVQKEDMEDLASIRQDLEAELNGIEAKLEAQVFRMSSVFRDLAQQLGHSLEDLKHLAWNHPLRSHPFLFSALPCLRGQSIQLFIGGGIILVVGPLAAAWGLDPNLAQSRETIRTAQELGINILNFAWRRRQMMQLVRQP